MADILHDLTIEAPSGRVFLAVSTPEGIDRWWTKRSAGRPSLGAELDLGFGPGYEWRARVTRFVPDSELELEMTRADEDWTGTRVGFLLEARGSTTRLAFRHTGWASPNDHFRTSSYCWASYLRLLRRHLEHGETVPYEDRPRA